MKNIPNLVSVIKTTELSNKNISLSGTYCIFKVTNVVSGGYLLKAVKPLGVSFELEWELIKTNPRFYYYNNKPNLVLDVVYGDYIFGKISQYQVSKNNFKIQTSFQEGIYLKKCINKCGHLKYDSIANTLTCNYCDYSLSDVKKMVSISYGKELR